MRLLILHNVMKKEIILSRNIQHMSVKTISIEIQLIPILTNFLFYRYVANNVFFELHLHQVSTFIKRTHISFKIYQGSPVVSETLRNILCQAP